MRTPSRTLRRYALFQVPGWIASVAILLLLHEYYDLEIWLGACLLLLLLVKDVVFYPVLRRSYERGTGTVGAGLVGETGVARERLEPRGYVMVHGELWQARIGEGSRPIDAGTKIRVEADEGLMLTVCAETPAPADQSG